jgi:hypothetical protein
MTNKSSLLFQKEIENRIFTFRSNQVMIDRDLAEIYGIETKVLNQAVKRNIERFPSAFMFQLTGYEIIELVTICDRFQNMKHSSVMPYVFTEQGIAMLSAVLRSDTAVKVSIQIMNAFVEMRKLILGNAFLFQRLDKMELKQIESNQKFEQIFKALEHKQQPEKAIFFDGQMFDAYAFIADIIKNSGSSLILIDNYVDESVLLLLTKRKKAVSATIYTKQISKQFQLDLKKHNEQYPAIEVKILNESHDRFLIVDHKELYHIGASLKDLGKKWFAFSKMDSLTKEVLARLK